MKRLSKIALGAAAGWILAAQPVWTIPALLVIIAIALSMESNNE